LYLRICSKSCKLYLIYRVPCSSNVKSNFFSFFCHLILSNPTLIHATFFSLKPQTSLLLPLDVSFFLSPGGRNHPRQTFRIVYWFEFISFSHFSHQLATSHSVPQYQRVVFPLRGVFLSNLSSHVPFRAFDHSGAQVEFLRFVSCYKGSIALKNSVNSSFFLSVIGILDFLCCSWLLTVPPQHQWEMTSSRLFFRSSLLFLYICLSIERWSEKKGGKKQERENRLSYFFLTSNFFLFSVFFRECLFGHNYFFASRKLPRDSESHWSYSLWSWVFFIFFG